MGLLYALLWTVAGLPWTAWLLWAASVGLGLAVVVWFRLTHREKGSR